jgi:hypothetical protein
MSLFLNKLRYPTFCTVSMSPKNLNVYQQQKNAVYRYTLNTGASAFIYDSIIKEYV